MVLWILFISLRPTSPHQQTTQCLSFFVCAHIYFCFCFCATSDVNVCLSTLSLLFFVVKSESVCAHDLQANGVPVSSLFSFHSFSSSCSHLCFCVLLQFDSLEVEPVKMCCLSSSPPSISSVSTSMSQRKRIPSFRSDKKKPILTRSAVSIFLGSRFKSRLVFNKHI